MIGEISFFPQPHANAAHTIFVGT
ncbi:MAG: hypothetical protein QOG17_3170, partial [Gammaproteobacteria bacterium]|nr:hypothetical protein [Gammaproteobacteria bacterium]